MHKILIIPAKGEDNLYNLFPLIKGIQTHFEEDEEEYRIYLFHGLDLSHQSALIKGQIEFHQFDENNLGPLGSLKVAQKEVDLFNLTHSFCFRDDVGAVTLHKYLKAKKRYGYNSIQGKLVNNHQLEGKNFSSKKQFYYNLFSHFFNVAFQDTATKLRSDLKNHKDNSENFFKANEVGPFLFMAFDEVKEESEVHLLLKSIAHSFDQKIYLWTERVSETVDKLFKENENLVDISEANPLNFDAYLDKCLGSITNELWLSEMSSYFGVDSLLFDCKTFEDNDFANPNVMLAKIIGPGFFDLKIIDGEEVFRELNIDSLNDHIHEFFTL